MKKFLTLILFCLCTLLTWAQGSRVPPQQDEYSWWNEDYNTTEGTEYYVTYMLNYGSQQEDNDIHLQLFATARQDADVSVYACTGYEMTEFITSFHVAAGGRSANIEIPNEKAYLREAGKHYKSLYIRSTTPISLFAYNFLDGSQDATAVYPINSDILNSTTNFIGRNYSPNQKQHVIQTYNTDGVVTEFAIVATEDSTSLDIMLKETSFNRFNQITLKYMDTVSVDTIIKDTLNRGQVYFYRSSSSRPKRS